LTFPIVELELGVGHNDHKGGSMETINVAEAKRRFSEILSRAAGGERILIQRREHPVAVLVSSAEWQRLERAAQTALQLAEALGQSKTLLRQIESGEAHPAMAAFGLWEDVDDLALLTEEIALQRRQGAKRGEVTFEDIG
jgi:prevent-host-death family protein